MRLRKRYFGIGLFAVFYLTCQMEFLSFRKPDAVWQKDLTKEGAVVPNFYDYDFEGRNMHYAHAGTDTLPLVVLVHGAPGSSLAFMEYFTDTALTKHAQIVAVDRPGYGYSGYGKAERSLEKQAQSLKHILLRHRKSKAILVGHSYGGPVVVRMAMDFPELVDGLVLISGSIDPALEPNSWWAKVLDWAVFRWMLPPAFRVANREIVPLKNELLAMEHLYGKVTCPVTVIQGDKDSLVPKGNADYAKKMFRQSSALEVRILEGKGHFILWEIPKTIHSEIVKLLGAK